MSWPFRESAVCCLRQGLDHIVYLHVRQPTYGMEAELENLNFYILSHHPSRCCGEGVYVSSQMTYTLWSLQTFYIYIGPALYDMQGEELGTGQLESQQLCVFIWDSMVHYPIGYCHQTI